MRRTQTGAIEASSSQAGAGNGQHSNHQGCLRGSSNFRWLENWPGRCALCFRQSRRRGAPDALVRMGCPSGLDWRESVLGQQKQIAIGFSVKRAQPGAWTAALLLASAFGASALSAAPTEPNCRAIESISARLSCYDAAFPPKVKKPAETAIESSSGYTDPFLAEEARSTAKLKNICRGC